MAEPRGDTTGMPHAPRTPASEGNTHGRGLPERAWQAIILASAAAALLVSAYCLAHDITIIFVHLYYFPIILLAYRYRFRGFPPAILLALSYVWLVYYFQANQTSIVLGAWFRVIVFMGIAAVVAYLSERLAQTTKAPHDTAEVMEQYISNAPAIVLALDTSGNITLLNRQGCAILECRKEDVIGKSWFELFIRPEDRNSVREVLRQIVAGNVTPYMTADNPVLTLKGQEKIIRWHNAALHDEYGAITGVLATGEDVTERKKAEDALVQSEEKFHLMADWTYDWEYWIAPDRRIVYMTPSAERISGYRAEEFVTDRFLIDRIIHPDDRAIWQSHVAVHTDPSCTKETVETEFRIVAKDGSVRWIAHLCRPICSANGENLGRRVSNRDVTGRRLAEENLAANEEKFRQFFNNVNDALYLHELDERGMPGRFIEVNDVMCKRLGYTRDELLVLAPQDILSGAGRQKMPAILEEMKRKGHATFETEHRRKDGSIMPVEVSTVLFSLAGVRIALASARDITERKKAVEALALSEAQYRTLAEASPDQIFINDRDGIVLYANTTALEMFGLPYDKVIGKRRKDIFPPGLEESQAADFARVFQTGELLRRETRIRFGGEERWIDVNLVPLKDGDGTTTAVLGIARDLTDRKRMEDDLRHQRRRLESIIQGTRAGTWEWNVQTGETVFNERWAQIIGYTLAELAPVSIRTWETLAHPDDLKMSGELLARHFSGELPYYEYESRMQHKDGHWVWILDRGRVMTRTEDGRPLMMYGTHSDITEHRMMEDEVRASRQLFSDIISFLPDATFVIDRDGTILAWNRAIERISGISAAEMIGKGDEEYSIWQYGKRRPLLIDLVLHPDLEYEGLNYRNVHKEGTTLTAEAEIRTADGRILELSLIASPLFDDNGTIVGAIESLRDVTRLKETEAELARMNANLEQIVQDRTRELEAEVRQRREAEERIRASLDEKILLLREIHHRVKNNLQIIISLLSLQSRAIADPNVVSALKESTQRIRAMSMVHEKLYTGKDLGHIGFQNYAASLANAQIAFYQPGPGRIGLEITGEDVMLDINTAIPLGLIINELTGNALKHAFPDGRTGTVRIGIRERDGSYEVTVADDGIGIPASVDWEKPSSLGLRLVSSLVSQLNGTIRLDRAGGTAFTITIPVKNNG